MIDQCALSNAFSLFDEGAYAQAEALLHPLREEAEMNDPALPNILLLMTHVESALKKFPTARTCGHQLLDIWKKTENEHVAIHQLAMIERLAAEYQAALGWLNREKELLDAYFPQSHPESSLRHSANLYEQGYIAYLQNDWAAAHFFLEESLQLGRKAGDAMSIGCALRALGEWNCAQNNMEAARALWSEAVEAFQQAGDSIACQEIQAWLSDLKGRTT